MCNVLLLSPLRAPGDLRRMVRADSSRKHGSRVEIRKDSPYLTATDLLDQPHSGLRHKSPPNLFSAVGRVPQLLKFSRTTPSGLSANLAWPMDTRQFGSLVLLYNSSLPRLLGFTAPRSSIAFAISSTVSFGSRSAMLSSGRFLGQSTSRMLV